MQATPFPADESPEERALRADTYALLSRLLAGSPDDALLRRLAALPGGEDGDAPLQQAWGMLAAVARGTPADALRAEYQAVFIGVTRGEVLPYASWYRTGFLMEKPLAALRADLARLGYARQPGVCEPEDHAAALCEVMGGLVAGADARQRDFLQHHLAPWLPFFFHDVQSAPSAAFYRPVGALGAAFMAFEAEYLGVELSLR